MEALVPNPDLSIAATYERVVQASLERVWENVLDWEHLPWLHARVFDSIEKTAAGPWGWRAMLGGGGGDAPSPVELRVDRDAGRYVVRTGGVVRTGDGTAEDGTAEGAGEAPKSEIWTSLDPVGEESTRVRVEFRVPPLPREALEQVGRVYVEIYTLLWDEDEEMMCERAERLREQSQPPADTPVDLGTEQELRARLPLDVVFEGRRFRVDERGGRFVAHPTVCPHMLGPLFRADDGLDDEADVLECPWHGYRYDAARGRSCDGHGLRLPVAPEVSLDAVPGRCTLVGARG